MKVNNQDADPGCYVAGHHGQYGIDGLADVAAQFGIEIADEDTPAYWRRGAEAETADDAVVIRNEFGMGSHIGRPDECWDRHVWAGEAIEETLNNLTEGGSWEWQDGEFFLVQDERAIIGANPFDTLSVMGVDAKTGRYFARSFENHGFYRHYDVAVDGRVWTLTGETERARTEFSADGRTQTISWEWRPQDRWLPLLG